MSLSRMAVWALLALAASTMLACSGTVTPEQPSAVATPVEVKQQPQPQPQPELEPEQIPVGSPVVIRGTTGGNVYVVDGVATRDRLETFLRANDRKGENDLINAGRVAILRSGSYAKLISYPSSGLVEVRVQSGEQKGKLWLVDPEYVEDNRTTPDEE